MKPQDVVATVQLHAGLEGIVVAHTAISDVDGERGALVIAGAAAESLAGGKGYAETRGVYSGGDFSGHGVGPGRLVEENARPGGWLGAGV